MFDMVLFKLLFLLYFQISHAFLPENINIDKTLKRGMLLFIGNQGTVLQKYVFNQVYYGNNQAGQSDAPEMENFVSFGIPKSLSNWRKMLIDGVLPSDRKKFSIHLIDTSTENIGLEIIVDFSEKKLILRSVENGETGREDISELFQLGDRDVALSIIIETKEDTFEISINGQWDTFEYVFPVEQLNRLLITGDVEIFSIDLQM